MITSKEFNRNNVCHICSYNKGSSSLCQQDRITSFHKQYITDTLLFFVLCWYLINIAIFIKIQYILLSQLHAKSCQT